MNMSMEHHGGGGAMAIGIGGRSFSISVDVADPCMGNLANIGGKDSKDKDSNVVHVRCKDLRVVSVEFVRTEDAADVADSLEKLSALDDVARSTYLTYTSVTDIC